MLAKPLANGDVAVAFYNEGDVPLGFSTTAAALGIGGSTAYSMTNLWTKRTLSTSGAITANVEPHGTLVYRVHRNPAAATAYPPHVFVDAVVPGASNGPLVVMPGVDTPVTMTVAQNGPGAITGVSLRVQAPSTWTLRTSDAVTAARLTSGSRLTSRWTLHVPAPTKQADYGMRVTATYTWGNGTTTSVSRVLTVPVRKLPAAGTTDLTDLTYVGASNGWGPVEIDRSNGEQPAGDGRAIKIGGHVYLRGLGTHADSLVTYYVGGRCSRITTDAGIDDEKGVKGAVTFDILGDGVLKAASNILTVNDPPRRITADLTGVTWLTLFADSMASSGGSTLGDHADWAGPKLTCSCREARCS